MPELAVGYLIGVLATAGLVALHIILQYRKQSSAEMRFIQRNLKKINFFWSDCEAAIKEYTDSAEKKDIDKSIKSVLLSGIGFMFLSWLGFIFQFIVMLSLRYLAVKRIERNLFASEIAQKDLSPNRIQELISKI